MNCLWCDESITRVSWGNLFSSARPQLLCDTCDGQLETINLQNCCSRCSKHTNSKLCDDCIEWDTIYNQNSPLTKNISLFKYNDFLKEVITKWKYRGDYVLAHAFKSFLTDYFYDFFPIRKILIVPIPLSNDRLLERGFNQVEVLATLLPGKVEKLLTRIHSEKQSKKSRHERLMSDNPFICHTRIQKPVILVDDIYTTGATIHHAAERLRDKGCPDIYSLTLARG